MSEEVEDPFGQIGNFAATFSVIKDSNDSRLTTEIPGESFTFGGGDNRKLMDAEEKKFELSDDINVSFSNLTTSDNTVSRNLYSQTVTDPSIFSS